MKRRHVLIVAMLAGFLTMVSVTALAQEKKVKPSKEIKTKKMKTTEEAKTKKILLGEAAQLSPVMLLGKAKELELTDVQQKKLVAIMMEMQKKTMGVLTKAQVAKVQTWKPDPQTDQTMIMALPMTSHTPSGAKIKKTKGADNTKPVAKKTVAK